MDDTQYPIVRGAVQLPAGSEIITDVDEEIFILYSNLQSAGSDTESSGFRGLGHLDSRKDVLDIIFDLKGISNSKSKDSRKGKKSKAQRTHESDNANDKTIQIELFQDKTALRTRKGDTGSVIWKASIDFAQYVLQQNYTNSINSLFHHERLRDQHVLELGAGTGLLSMVLSPLVRRYTATDIGPLIPLIQKNVSLNFAGWPKLPSGSPGSNISVEELDWQLLQSSTAPQRAKLYTLDPVDLLLVVDCIYHPSLIPPLVATINHLAIPQRTTVLIVSELRSHDVMREFLDTWLAQPKWEIWHVGSNVLGSQHYVMWLGQKLSTSE